MVNSKKVLIALSGGIDSAVSAHLLIKQGYEVEAAFMKNWSSTEGLKYDECPWLTDRQDALRVAAHLKIPMHTLDFEKEYKKNVLNYFFNEYRAGRTPNPDVMCNKEIKFKMFYNWAMKRGFDYMATGHYARIGVRDQALGVRKNSNLKPTHSAGSGQATYNLLRSADEFKDQTYFIYNIKTEQLPHLLFPVGGMKKSSVRALAKKFKLPNADKKESMGLCFVGKIRLKDFLEQKLKRKPGKIVDAKGGVIGEHQGLYYYTIGQRQGIKVGAGGPYYVTKKDLKRNMLHVTSNKNDPALQIRELEIHSLNWIEKTWSMEHREWSKKLKAKSYKLLGRFRHQSDLVPLTLKKSGKGLYRVKFTKPQNAVASGQSLVLYDGKICLGGGVIV